MTWKLSLLGLQIPLPLLKPIKHGKAWRTTDVVPGLGNRGGWVVFFSMGKLPFSPLAAESLSISKCSSLQRDYRGGDTEAGALTFIPLIETYSVPSWSPAWAWLHLLPFLIHWFNLHRLLVPQQMPADINKILPLDSKGLCVSLLRYMDWNDSWCL